MTLLQNPETEDRDLHELFAPLAADEPTPAELSALRRRAATTKQVRAGARRPAWRLGAAVTGATAAVAVGLAVLPSADDGTRPAGAAAVLHAAAAVAADQVVPPVADGPLRYAKVRATFVYSVARDGRVAQSHHQQIVETWVGSQWNGRTVSEQGHMWITGDADLARAALPFSEGHDPLDKPRDGAYAYGDGPLAELDPATLPSDRDGIAAALRDGIRDNTWALRPADRGRPQPPGAPSADSFVTYSIIGLLVNARLTAQQRAALLDVLAADPAARSLGDVTDGDGRTGTGIELAYSGNQMLAADRFRVIFDPKTSEVLEWSMTPPGGDDHPGAPWRTETVLATGYAQETGERP